MTNRITAFGFAAVLLLVGGATGADSGSPRKTPLVRALERAKSCVVNIHSEKTAQPGESVFNSGKGRKVNGMGTGIVVDERGYIVTNHHVVDGVESLRATLDDGSTYDAQIVSFDRARDLAIIRIKTSKPLQVMPMGTSSDLMLGETVIAVGNAFGYEGTVTSGIVSSLSRDVEVNEKQSYKALIQTDASINPGNSGGPLLNLEGEVVGINVAIRAGAQRIGFAIPIDEARKIIARLMSVEQLSRTYHGVVTRDHKQGEDRKLLIDTVQPSSPAASAGLKPGDVIIKAAGKDIIDGADFERALLGKSAGDEVPVQVKRHEKSETVTLTLAQAQARTDSSAARAPELIVRANNDTSLSARTWQTLGMKLAPVPASERAITGSRYRGGMRVLEVRSAGPAEVHGIQPGDVLVGLHVWETISVENVSYILDHPQLSTFNPLKFYVLRGSETFYGHMRLSF